MNGLPRQHGLPGEGSPRSSGKNWIPPAKPLKLARETVICSQPVRLTVLPPDHGLFCIAEPRRRLDQRVKHSLEIERRPADYLEHVGGGGLLLQRFAQLVQQPRVLDGNDRLVGEGRHQLDLFRSERLRRVSSYKDHADDIFLAQEWYAERGSV